MVPASVLRRKCATSFGRRAVIAPALPQRQPTKVADDVRLFATFFLGGLTFMSVYLA